MSLHEKIQEHYLQNRDEIDGRLKDFQKVSEADDRRWFKELVFVILTSRSSAREAWNATEKLGDMGFLLEGSVDEITGILENYEINYERNKAGYIVENRKKLSQPTFANPEPELRLRDRIDTGDLKGSREWLVESVKGLGWKGASHFLRNIGHGDGFAIISGPVINQLNDLGMSLSRPSDKEEYIEIENSINELSGNLDIDIQAFDLVLWSMRTGEVFK